MADKQCTKCGERKPQTEFYRADGCRDGLRPECKKCLCSYLAARNAMPTVKAAAKVHRAKYYQDNRNRILVKLAEYREQPGNRERAARRSAAWMAIPQNAARHAMQSIIYRCDPVHRARATLKRSEWQRRNPDGVRVHHAKRKAAKINASGSHTRDEIKALLDTQNFRCANPLCGIDRRIEQRHLDQGEPVARGGSNSIDNLQWLCAPCNLHKKMMSKYDWFAMVRMDEAIQWPI